MIRRDRSNRLLALAWLAVGAAACVPRSDPPAGQQLVADRVALLAGIVPSTGDGMARVLVMRPGQDAQSSDLYVVSAASNGGPPSERFLATNITASLNGVCLPGQRACFRSDARGRVFLATNFDPITGSIDQARIDPVTGGRLEIPGGTYTLSPSGRRLLVYRADAHSVATSATLYEADDRARSIEDSTSIGFGFNGDDLFYITAQQELMRIVPDGAPERLAIGVAAWGIQAATNGLLVLGRPTADPMVNLFSVLDLVTLEETPSPFGDAQFTVSPSGRWLLSSVSNSDATDIRLRFFDRLTGAEDVFQLPPGFFGGGYEWRPGHDEVWMSNGQSDAPKIWIKKPGAPESELFATSFSLTEVSANSPSSFTSDGTYWFSVASGLETGVPKIQVGAADDPNGPRFDISPNGNASYEYWSLPDGRLLMPRFVRSPQRSDLFALNPANGDNLMLGKAGMVLTVGQTRLLATLHVNDGLGDLTTIELASGRQSVLAPECTVAAFVEPLGADRVAAGAHVGYQYQARFPSPYDGIWVATIP